MRVPLLTELNHEKIQGAFSPDSKGGRNGGDADHFLDHTNLDQDISLFSEGREKERERERGKRFSGCFLS